MFKEITKTVCPDQKNVTLTAAAHRDNFHVTVTE